MARRPETNELMKKLVIAAVAAALKHREMAMTTGIGYEIGIPHASTHLVTEVVGVIGRSRKGINFEALDGKPVKLVVLFLVPAGELKKHADQKH